MAYDYLLIDDVLAENSSYESMFSRLGRGLAIASSAKLDEYIASNQVADVAFCDLRWRDDGNSTADFDGLDAISILETSGLCRKVIVLTDGGHNYRHWIEEARRSPIVVAGVLKWPAGDDSLVEIVGSVMRGERCWNIMPPGRDGRVVVDILGSDRFTAKGRLVAAMLESTNYKDVAQRLSVGQQTVKDLVPKLQRELRDIGEKNIDGDPRPAVAGWIGENRSYLLGWRRRVQSRMPANPGVPTFGDAPLT